MAEIKMYDISARIIGKSMAKVFISTYVSKIKVAVMSAYLKSCFLPFRFDSVNTMCLDKKKPRGKLIQKEII